MNDLIEEYRKQAAIHGECTREGNSKRANAAHDKLTNLATAILNSSDPKALMILFNDDDESVQLCAATHFLEVNEGKATKKLRELSSSNDPIISTVAGFTLDCWNKGEIRKLTTKSKK